MYDSRLVDGKRAKNKFLSIKMKLLKSAKVLLQYNVIRSIDKKKKQKRKTCFPKIFHN